MEEQNQNVSQDEEQEPDLTTEEKIDIIGDLLVVVCQKIDELQQTIQNINQPPQAQTGVPYQSGYPMQPQQPQPQQPQPQPAAQQPMQYMTQQQVSNQLPQNRYANNQQYAGPPQAQQNFQQPMATQTNMTERVMTPDEYRKEYGE